VPEPAVRRVVPMLVGPTAVGKTAVAEALAQAWSLAVISADSRQVYRGLDIGTAKPSAELRARIPHCGLDLVEPGERYSAGQFARDAARWLQEVEPERRAIVVGGTGFYVRAITDGLFREPPLPAPHRERLREYLRGVGPVAAWAARLDPAFSGGGRQRAARVVEVALLSGRSLSWWQARARAEGLVEPWTVRLTLPRAMLRRRITERAAGMLEAGLVGEVEQILARGIAADAPGLDAVGYREVVQCLQGRLPRDGLLDAIVTATARYAKRQETWFRHQITGEVVTLDATAPPTVTAASILTLWQQRGN
jgi:tRNA dimethylallyltransferase